MFILVIFRLSAVLCISLLSLRTLVSIFLFSLSLSLSLVTTSTCSRVALSQVKLPIVANANEKHVFIVVIFTFYNSVMSVMRVG